MPQSKPEFRDRALFVRLFGADVYAVGGYVRDLLRGAEPAEVDLLVARRTVEDIVAKLAPHGKVDLVGRSFGVIKFTRRGPTYDIALPRVGPGAGGRPGGDTRTSSSGPIPACPSKRTCGGATSAATASPGRLSDGRLIDPFDGRADIRARRLRVTDPAAFPEDPLRVLRAARFASVLGFRVDPAIYRSGQGHRPGRPERRTDQRGALPHPAQLAPAFGRPGGALPAGRPAAALPRALRPDPGHPGLGLPPREGRLRPPHRLAATPSSTVDQAAPPGRGLQDWSRRGPWPFCWPRSITTPARPRPPPGSTSAAAWS